MNFKKFFDRNPNKVKDEESFNIPVQGFGGNIGNEEKKVLSPGYDANRFHNMINTLYSKGQYKRQDYISNLFFRDFIGLELIDGKITDILSSVDKTMDYNFYGFKIKIDNKGEVMYSFYKENDIITEEHVQVHKYIEFNKTKQLTEVEKKGISRKDARLITKIVKKFNPETEKYKVGTGDLTIKEYESIIYKFNDFLNEKKYK